MTDYEILLQLAIILLFTKSFGIIMRKLGMPQVVGALIAGIIIGPMLLGWVKPNSTINIIAELGVIMIMFSAGIETDLKEIKQSGLKSTLVASLGVLLPLITGFLLACIMHGGFKNMDKITIYKNIFIGIIFTATSVSITVETLRELGKLKTKSGTIILSAAIIDDIIGMVLLSIVVGLNDQSENPLKTIGLIALFFVLAIGIGIGLHYLFKHLAVKYPNHRRVPILALVICLIYAYLGEKIFHVADITAAYIAGITLSGIKASDYIEKKIDINAYMIFAPVFFANIGIKATLNGLTGNMIVFSILFVVFAILAKFVGCYSASRMLKIDRSNSAVIGIGMIARGEVALIVMQKGIAAGIIDPHYIVMGVLLVLTSSLIAPILLRLLFKHIDKSTMNISSGNTPIVETAIPPEENVEKNPSTQPLI